MSSSAGQLPEESEIIAHCFDDDGSIPNNPTLPLLIYPGAIDVTGSDPAAAADRYTHGTNLQNRPFSRPHPVRR